MENILSADYVRHQAKIGLNDISIKKEDGLFTIVSLGRFTHAKAFDWAILASGKLVDDGIRFKWYIFGFGPQDSWLKDLIKQYKLEGVVFLLPAKSNPFSDLLMCNLYVQPSRYEGKSVAVREAQMLGLPVMITNYPTSCCQVEHGQDGYVVPLSIDGIVEGVKTLYFDKTLRESIAQNAAMRDYSNINEVKKITSILS